MWFPKVPPRLNMSSRLKKEALSFPFMKTEGNAEAAPMPRRIETVVKRQIGAMKSFTYSHKFQVDTLKIQGEATEWLVECMECQLDAVECQLDAMERRIVEMWRRTADSNGACGARARATKRERNGPTFDGSPGCVGGRTTPPSISLITA